MLSTSTLATLVVAFLAVQASAGSAHTHRRHHARHGKRACRAKVNGSGTGSGTGAAAGAGQEQSNGNGSGYAAGNYTDVSGASAVPSDGAAIIPASASGSSTGSETASTIGHELAATGASSAAPTPTQVINPNNPDPVAGFIASSAGQTGSDNGLIDLSISLGIGHGQSDYPPSAVPTSSTSTTASYGSEIVGSIHSSASNTSASSLPSSVVVVPVPSSSATAPVTTTPGPSNGKRVFAHYMVGIVSQYQQGDWEKDMQVAKAHAIDGFALNIGVDPYTEEQLDLAYAAAEAVDFDVFISFDFNWFHISDVDKVSTIFKRYMDKPKQYKVDGKPFVSTFIGDGFDWGAVETQVGKPIYSVPFYEPTPQNAELPSVSGLFSWSAWPGQVGNVPVKQQMSDARDLLYMSYTDPIQKDYMAPVSPWFFTHFGPEVSYSKNWLFYSETLWYDRWEQILKMQDNLRFLEIVTWNDYGESHYIGPLDTAHSDDGSGIYTKGLDHTAHLEFAVPYIKAFKSGSKTPIIEQDMLVYWYRPHLKSASCDSTDNCGKKPDGWDMVEDQVFVATMTKNGGSFTVTSGGNSVVTNQAGAGVQVFKIPMGVGEQKFTFTANGANGGDTSTIPISADCWNGVYNYNYHSGSIKL